MEITTPKNWPEVPVDEFWSLMSDVNWSRDAYCGGEWFNAIGQEVNSLTFYADGRAFTEKLPRRIAIHTTNDRYFVNPQFFSTVPQ